MAETRYRLDSKGRPIGLDWEFHRAPEPEDEDQEEG